MCTDICPGYGQIWINNDLMLYQQSGGKILLVTLQMGITVASQQECSKLHIGVNVSVNSCSSLFYPCSR